MHSDYREDTRVLHSVISPRHLCTDDELLTQLKVSLTLT